MARFKRATSKKVIATALVVGALTGSLVGYTGGVLSVPAPVVCELEPKMKVMGRCAEGICEFSVEKCQDGTMKLSPMGYTPDDPDAGPKSEL